MDLGALAEVCDCYLAYPSSGEICAVQLLAGISTGLPDEKGQGYSEL